METLKNVFSDELSAFRKGYNTQYVLMHLVEKWKNVLDQSKSCGTLLMDLSKAFDCISHDLLIAKLQAYGMDENALTFMSSYLRYRKQCVKIQGYNSEWLNLSKGEVYKSIHQMTPIYIQEMFNIKITPYDLRDPCRTVMPKAKTTTHGPLHMKEIASGTICPYILKVQKAWVFLKRG